MKLPTLKTFLRWPIEKRAVLFGRWLAAQRRSRALDYWDTEGCPLARFGNAITHTCRCSAGGVSFTTDGGKDVLVGAACVIASLNDQRERSRFAALANSTTYGQAADAYAAALKLPLS